MLSQKNNDVIKLPFFLRKREKRGHMFAIQNEKKKRKGFYGICSKIIPATPDDLFAEVIWLPAFSAIIDCQFSSITSFSTALGY